MRPLLVATALLACAPAWANYAACIIDKMPGVANDTAATAVFQVCKAEHPGAIQSVPQGSGRGMFSFKSGAECTAKKAGDTRSNQAAFMIGVACRKLYDEDGPWNQHRLTPFNGKLDGEK